MAFVNSVARVNQLPPTIARLSFLQRNNAYMPLAPEVLAKYKQRLLERQNAKKESKKRARDSEETEDEGGVAPDAGDLDLDSTSDVPMPQYEELAAGLCETELMDWLGTDAGASAGAAVEVEPVETAAVADVEMITGPSGP